ncbi:hypothetical protein F511_02212 [Dorcoceras hygrometricum]|uniref:RWP-RK domain-containing protein n=1 Tax=Dorcoceras hygrometricum TaxID=472368 RepID=A0A2Z7ANE4_9LAMI|nr:hypothetical protein F511_02212 [Dorcoceras hygrometricum]
MAAANKEYEDIYCHFPTFLYDDDHSSTNGSFSAWNWQLGILENDRIVDPFPLMDTFVSSSDIVASSGLVPVPDFLCDDIKGAFEVRNEGTASGLEVQTKEQKFPPNNDFITGEAIQDCESEAKRSKLVARNSAPRSRTLCRETISKYFHLPITQAAKELNVGPTLLKKKCRDLGIKRWPHRKLISMQTLIKNVQELWEYEGEEKVKQAICLLEEEMKLMIEIPEMEIGGSTKRLRQACFKANYKKRKLVIPQYSASPLS